VIWDWQQWHQEPQTHLNQHAPHYASMLAYNADQRPTARDLLGDFFPQPTHAPLQIPQTNVTWTSFGESSFTNQANGTTIIHSAAPTPMEWTQTVATAIFQGSSQPTQRNKRTQPPQPNPVMVQSPKATPNRPAQPIVRRGGSVKSARSADERQRKGHTASRLQLGPPMAQLRSCTNSSVRKAQRSQAHAVIPYRGVGLNLWR
jgi:hypothetical protein